MKTKVMGVGGHVDFSALGREVFSVWCWGDRRAIIYDRVALTARCSGCGKDITSRLSFEALRGAREG